MRTSIKPAYIILLLFFLVFFSGVSFAEDRMLSGSIQVDGSPFGYTALWNTTDTNKALLILAPGSLKDKPLEIKSGIDGVALSVSGNEWLLCQPLAVLYNDTTGQVKILSVNWLKESNGRPLIEYLTVLIKEKHPKGAINEAHRACSTTKDGNPVKMENPKNPESPAQQERQ